MSTDGFSVTGLDELEKRLLELDLKASGTVLRRAGRLAMQPVLKDMREGANVQHGDLRDAITMRAAKGRARERNRAATIRVGPLKKKPGVNQKAIAQEFGTAKQTAEPFIRPALDRNQRRVIDTLARAIAAELKRVS